MNKEENRLKRFYLAAETFVGCYIPASVLFFTMCFIMSEVIGRFAFSHSIKAQVEIVGLTVVLVCFLSLSIVQRNNQQIQVSILQDKLSGQASSILRGLTLIFSLMVVMFLCYATGKFALVAYAKDYATMQLRLVHWPIVVLMFFGLLSLSIRLAIQIKENFGRQKDISG